MKTINIDGTQYIELVNKQFQDFPEVKIEQKPFYDKYLDRRKRKRK